MESEVTDNNVAPGFFVLNDLCFKVLCDKWNNLWWYILSLTVTKQKKRCTSWFYWCSAIYFVVFEYSILFPTFAFFQNVFHLPFGDKSIIRFKAANSVQCISLNEFLEGEDIEVTNVEKNRKIHWYRYQKIVVINSVI